MFPDQFQEDSLSLVVLVCTALKLLNFLAKGGGGGGGGAWRAQKPPPVLNRAKEHTRKQDTIS